MATLDTLLTKLVNIFKKDMYIVDCKYCIAGDESEKESQGKQICILEDPCVKVIMTEFPDCNAIYVSNVRKAKNERDLIQTDLTEDKLMELRKEYTDILTVAQGNTVWRSFEFTDDMVQALFREGKIVPLPVKNKNDPVMVVSKNLFPLITEKRLSSVVYNIKKDNTGTGSYLFIKHDFDLFVHYNIIFYIHVSPLRSED